MGGSGPSNTKQTTTFELPKWLLPYVQALAAAGTNLALPGAAPDAPAIAQSPLPYQQIAPFTPDQMNAFGAIEGMGASSPMVGKGEDFLTNFLSTPYQSPISSDLQNRFLKFADQPAPDIYKLAGPQYKPPDLSGLKTTAPDIKSLLAGFGPPLFSGGWGGS